MSIFPSLFKSNSRFFRRLIRLLQSAPILWRDIYLLFVKAHLKEVKLGWNNGSKDDSKSQIKDAESCRQECLDREQCLQWYFTMGNCTFSERITLGQSELTDGGNNSSTSSIVSTSGWIMDRLQAFEDTHKECKTEWIYQKKRQVGA